MTSTPSQRNQPEEPSVRQLIISVATDMSTLVSAQVELAKVELKESASQAASAFSVLIAAAVLVGLGGIFLLVTIAYVLVAFGLPVWAGFGIVTLALFIVGAILALVGKKHIEKVQPPERAIEQFNETGRVFANEANRALLGNSNE